MNLVEALQWCPELKMGRSGKRGRVYHVWEQLASPDFPTLYYRYEAIGCEAKSQTLKRSIHMLPPNNDKPICKKCETEAIFRGQNKRKAYYNGQDNISGGTIQ